MFGLLFVRRFHHHLPLWWSLLLPSLLLVLSLVISQKVWAEQQDIQSVSSMPVMPMLEVTEEQIQTIETQTPTNAQTTNVPNSQPSTQQQSQQQKESQVEQEIRRDVTRYLEKKAQSLTQGMTNSKTVVSIQMPTANSTERLSPCTDTLVLEDNQKGAGRQRVKVTCNGFRRWSVYVGGDIALEVPVLVTTRALRKGDSLTAADVTHRLENVSKSRGDYMTNLAALKGQTLRRSISAGTVLEPEFFERTAIIRQGDRVAIISGNRGFRITVTGVAQQDGAMGETIRVKNSSSGKTLTGTVEGVGEVVVH